MIVAGVRSETGASRILLELGSTNNSRLTVILSNPLISQYEEVLFRPEVRPSDWSDDELHAVIDSLLVPAEWAENNFSYRPLLDDDPGGEMVLEAAINGHADVIVTFNKRHFGPADRFGLLVLTPGEVLEMLNKRSVGYGAN